MALAPSGAVFVSVSVVCVVVVFVVVFVELFLGGGLFLDSVVAVVVVGEVGGEGEVGVSWEVIVFD